MTDKQCSCYIPGRIPEHCPVHAISDEQLREIAAAWRELRRRNAGRA